jgi:hypothetical protein
MPMETSQCAQYDSPVGGHHHGLLVVSDLRRTWSVNSVDLEFDPDREGVSGLGDGERDGSWNACLCHMIVLWSVRQNLISDLWCLLVE